jgi:hypothetical protein
MIKAVLLATLSRGLFEVCVVTLLLATIDARWEKKEYNTTRLGLTE